MRHLSGLEMARLVWGHTRGRRIMACIRAAFDSSKECPHGITTVAGYVADAEQWQSIEEEWSNFLVLNGLSKFRLTEVRRRFGDRWIEVVRPFAKIINKSKLRSVTASLRDTDWIKLDHSSAYRELCPHREHACLEMLFDPLSEEIRLEFNNEPVAIVFDTDWGNRDAIIRVHDAWCARTGNPGFNLFLKGGVPWDSIPLQTADLIAGLLRLDPFSTAMLDGQTLQNDDSPIADIARIAKPNGRGVMWSLALAQKVDEFLSRRK